VFPITAIDCEESALQQLLVDLDSIAWPHNDPDAARLLYEQHTSGQGIAGGMGGAVAAADGWIHRTFEDLQLADQVREVISGRRARIDGPRTR
jgi:hypothetical protein